MCVSSPLDTLLLCFILFWSSLVQQDHPLVDDIRLTLDYDLDAQLSAPRWLDGYQAFTGVLYHPCLVLLFDVRCLVPGSSTAAPAGWACLPVFEAAGAFVASGVYHLPLFQVRHNHNAGYHGNGLVGNIMVLPYTAAEQHQRLPKWHAGAPPIQARRVHLSPSE